MDLARAFLLASVVAVAACSSEELDPIVIFDLPTSDVPAVALPTRIAFGSCSDPRLPMDLVDVAAELEPELFIWLGDNVYADTTDPDVMRQRYLELGRHPSFVGLRERTHLLATWDDHDYGENDAGRDYPMRETSREIFLDFWQEPPDSPRHNRPGIYTSYTFARGDHTLQIILLDTRYNRDALTPNDGSGKNDYVPSSEGSVLGETQWAWLERELSEPADLRIIGSSIQVAHSYNGYESWTLFPHERERLLDLIRDTRAEGVFVISGDVHWAEVSQLEVEDGYPLLDVTSSGINQDWRFVEDNVSRVAGPVVEHNVGLLVIDWEAGSITATVHDAAREVRMEISTGFDQLTF